jgi:hypothetical protein
VRGIWAPSAIAVAIVPGQVVRGKVIGKKLRRTMGSDMPNRASTWLPTRMEPINST